MAFCTKCGASLADDSRFCTVCGTPNALVAPAEPVPADPVGETEVLTAPEAPAPAEPVIVAPAEEPPVVPAPPAAVAAATPVAQPRSSNTAVIVVLSVVCGVLLVALGVVGCLLFLRGQAPATVPADTTVTTLPAPVEPTPEETRAPTTAPTEAPTTTAPTEPPVYSISESYRVSARGGVKLYASPSSGSSILGSIGQGYIAVADRQCGSWVYVYTEASAGWAHLDGLRNLQNEPSVTPHTYSMSGHYGTVTTRDGTGVNMRTGPSTNYPVVTGIRDHIIVDVLEWQNGWYYVEHMGLYGWVSDDYLYIH